MAKLSNIDNKLIVTAFYRQCLAIVMCMGRVAETVCSPQGSECRVILYKQRTRPTDSNYGASDLAYFTLHAAKRLGHSLKMFSTREPRLMDKNAP